MKYESTVTFPKVNPLTDVDVDFDVKDPNGWYGYVADSLVLTGLARRSGYISSLSLIHAVKHA